LKLENERFEGLLVKSGLREKEEQELISKVDLK
jgi:hypothetical protein